MKYILCVVLVFMLSACSDDTTSRNCELVINPDGPGFLKVINRLDGRVYVFLPEYAFGAIINGNTCEIYGLATGTRRAEISICADSECDDYGNTKKVSFFIDDGETHQIVLTYDYFN
jgi:hypothetical protein